VLYKYNKKKDCVTFHYINLHTNSEMYYFKDTERKRFVGMHNLLLSYLISDIPITKTIEGVTYYAIEIIINDKVKEYLCKSDSECKLWLNNFKRIIKHNKFSEKYKLEELISDGKVASVYRGLNIKTKEVVCVKIIDKNKLNNKASMLYNEVLILKSLSHDNVVRYIDHFEDYNFIYVVMEYLQGGQLINYLNEQGGSISDQRKIDIMYQLGKGIEYLRMMGVLHRDIKPGNIGMSTIYANAIPKVIDFGLSTYVGDEEVLYKKCGTLYYMPPEIIMDKPYNKSIDIWSLGVVFYYIVYYCLPFSDEGNEEDKQKRMENICTKDVVFPHNEDFYIGKMRNVIYQCLRRSHNERTNVRFILEELENMKR
jgi:serine/threonine protein kinase